MNDRPANELPGPLTKGDRFTRDWAAAILRYLRAHRMYPGRNVTVEDLPGNHGRIVNASASASAASSTERQPWQPTVRKVEEVWEVSLYPGHVNNVTPSNMNAALTLSSGANKVYLDIALDAALVVQTVVLKVGATVPTVTPPADGQPPTQFVWLVADITIDDTEGNDVSHVYQESLNLTPRVIRFSCDHNDMVLQVTS